MMTCVGKVIATGGEVVRCNRTVSQECPADAGGLICGAPLCAWCSHLGGSYMGDGAVHGNEEYATLWRQEQADAAAVRRAERTARSLEEAHGRSLEDAIRFAISDPGAFCDRLRVPGDEYEVVQAWGARAVLMVLPGHPRAGGALTGLRPDPPHDAGLRGLTDDPLAVDLDAHGAVGMLLLPVSVDALAGPIVKGIEKAYGKDLTLLQHGRNLVFTRMSHTPADPVPAEEPDDGPTPSEEVPHVYEPKEPDNPSGFGRSCVTCGGDALEAGTNHTDADGNPLA